MWFLYPNLRHLLPVSYTRSRYGGNSWFPSWPCVWKTVSASRSQTYNTSNRSCSLGATLRYPVASIEELEATACGCGCSMEALTGPIGAWSHSFLVWPASGSVTIFLLGLPEPGRLLPEFCRAPPEFTENQLLSPGHHKYFVRLHLSFNLLHHRFI